MQIYIGSDHAGLDLKKFIALFLTESGYEVSDVGPFEYNADDDYPDFVKEVAKRVGEEDLDTKGIVIGKSGQGEAMCANRTKGVRAAVYYGGDLEIIKLSREHNNANVLSLAAGFLKEEEAKQAVKLWLETSFSGEQRHVRRINKFN